MRVVILLLAMMMHYHFIMKRITAANEEAIKVLEDLPEAPAAEEAN